MSDTSKRQETGTKRVCFVQVRGIEKLCRIVLSAKAKIGTDLGSSNSYRMNIGVKDGKIVGVRGRAEDRVHKGHLGPKGLHA